MIDQKEIEKIKSSADKKKPEGFKNLEKKMLKNVMNAIGDFGMIKEGETIVIGVSGGKDSMMLGYMLAEAKKLLKVNFKIRAVYIFKDFLINCDIEFEEKRKFYEDELKIPLEKIILSLPAESKVKDGLGQSCQWCAYARRITMMKLCKKWGASKIAFGHHMDDIVVTAFMNMLQGRNLKIMPPINNMSQGDVSFIRPLAYVREKDILKLILAKKIPFSGCACPIGEKGKRKEIKTMVWENEEKMPGYIDNIFWSLIKDFKKKYEESGYLM